MSFDAEKIRMAFVDAMAGLCVRYLSIYNAKPLPSSINNLPK